MSDSAKTKCLSNLPDDAMALLPGQNADAISMKTKELESQREGDIADDDYIALQVR